MNEIFDFDEIVERGNSDSVKWDKYAGRDILPMWVADSDFRVAPPIQQALSRRAEHGIFGYTHVPERLIEVIVERMQRLYDWEIKPSWLMWLPGVVGGLHLACRSNGEPGDGVYTPAVIYPPFSKAPALCARLNRPMPMRLQQQRMVIDLDWLAAEESKPGSVLMFCNPQNPGGAIYREDELSRLARIAEQQDLIVCSDEVHCDLLLDEGKRHIPIASLNEDIAQRSVTLMAPSKTFNLAGLSCAFAIVPNRELRQRMRRAAEGIVPYVNAMGYSATLAAYQSCDEWNRQQCNYLAANRDYLLEQINSIDGLSLNPIEATYLAWINVSALRLDKPMQFFEEAGVGFSPGVDFGDADYLRLNFACPRSRLEEAVARIRKAIAQL